LAATFVEEELELVTPFLPINRQQESRANWVEREQGSREQERKRELQWQQLQVQQESWKLSLSEVILLLHVLCCNPFSISNNMELSRGCRRFCRTTLNIVSQCA
jgi:hypothetical protein